MEGCRVPALVGVYQIKILDLQSYRLVRTGHQMPPYSEKSCQMEHSGLVTPSLDGKGGKGSVVKIIQKRYEVIRHHRSCL